ncbi:MAG: hypothetical protein HC902_10615, partial [Calothrix sp. SM1_5_4]|nr:hypothetical protein [Calothrix sp. SM1_5_4]
MKKPLISVFALCSLLFGAVASADMPGPEEYAPPRRPPQQGQPYVNTPDDGYMEPDYDGQMQPPMGGGQGFFAAGAAVIARPWRMRGGRPVVPPSSDASRFLSYRS